MSREYARVRVDIWVNDEEFRDLSPAAQHLYFVLLTSPDLSYCGVTDWRPGRIAARARGWTADYVRMASLELIRHLYIVVDEDTEEVLIRSFVRHDGVMKEARIAVSMVKAFGSVASSTLRGVLVHELQRLHEEDEAIADPAKRMKGWLTVKGDPGQALSLLSLRAVDPAGLVDELAQELDEELAVLLGQGLADRLGVGLAQTPDRVSGSVSGSTTPAPTPAPIPDSPTEEGGVGGGGSPRSGPAPRSRVGDPMNGQQPLLAAVPAEQPKTKAPSKRKPEVSFPDNFETTEGMRAWLRQRGVTDADADRQTELLRNWAHAKDARYVDWVATWRNWIIRAIDRGDVRTRSANGKVATSGRSPQAEWEM